MSINFYGLFLDHARLHGHSEPIRRVLNSLGDAIAAAQKTVDRAREEFVPEHYEAVCDDESDVVESLVGTAFVAAQTQITGVVSILKRLHEYAARNGVTLTTTTGGKDAIMRCASHIPSGTSFSRIEVINGCANYFKHHDEWTLPWSNLDRRSRPTALIIEAVGGSEGSTGNLRTGLYALGVDYDLLDLLHEEVSQWAEAVVAAYKTELSAAGLY